MTPILKGPALGYKLDLTEHKKMVFGAGLPLRKLKDKQAQLLDAIFYI